MAKLEWETVDNQHQRAKIHGGWLVKAYEDVVHKFGHGIIGGRDFRIAMCFVPDVYYEWRLEKVETEKK